MECLHTTYTVSNLCISASNSERPFCGMCLRSWNGYIYGSVRTWYAYCELSNYSSFIFDEINYFLQQTKVSIFDRVVNCEQKASCSFLQGYLAEDELICNFNPMLRRGAKIYSALFQYTWIGVRGAWNELVQRMLLRKTWNDFIYPPSFCPHQPFTARLFCTSGRVLYAGKQVFDFISVRLCSEFIHNNPQHAFFIMGWFSSRISVEITYASQQQNVAYWN